MAQFVERDLGLDLGLSASLLQRPYMVVLTPWVAVFSGEYQRVAGFAGQQVPEQVDALRVQRDEPRPPGLGLGNVDLPGAEIHVVRTHRGEFAMAGAGEQRAADERPEIGRAGIDQPQTFGIGQEADTCLVGFGEGAHLPPSRVVPHAAVLECSIEDGLENTQDAVCGCPACPFFVVGLGGCPEVGFLGQSASAEPGRSTCQFFVPRPDVASGQGVDQVITKGWRDVYADVVFGFLDGLPVLPKPRQVAVSRVFHPVRFHDDPAVNFDRIGQPARFILGLVEVQHIRAVRVLVVICRADGAQGVFPARQREFGGPCAITLARAPVDQREAASDGFVVPEFDLEAQARATGFQS